MQQTPTPHDYALPVLAQLEADAIHLLREVAAETRRPAMLLHPAGLASACLLRLAQKAFWPAAVPFALRESTDHDALLFATLGKELSAHDRRDALGQLWSLYNPSIGAGQCARIFPLASWTDGDVAQYAQAEQLDAPRGAAR